MSFISRFCRIFSSNMELGFTDAQFDGLMYLSHKLYNDGLNQDFRIIPLLDVIRHLDLTFFLEYIYEHDPDRLRDKREKSAVFFIVDEKYYAMLFSYSISFKELNFSALSVIYIILEYVSYHKNDDDFKHFLSYLIHKKIN